MAVLAGPVKPTYSYSDLEQIWIDAGGPQQYAAMAAAVAMAESGGRPDATNVNSNGSVDAGLWQVNSIHGYDPSSLLDPLSNAKAAVSISNSGANFRPWCTAWSDNACGQKGGSYLGGGSRALGFLNGSYSSTDGTNVFGTGTGVPPSGEHVLSGTQTGQLAQQQAARNANPCALSLPVVGCVIHRNTLEKAGGVLLIVGGGIVGLAGAALLFSAVGKNTLARQITRAIPGTGTTARAASPGRFREGEAPESSAARRAHQARTRYARKQRDEDERASARTAVIREREAARQRRFEDAGDAS